MRILAVEERRKAGYAYDIYAVSDGTRRLLTSLSSPQRAQYDIDERQYCITNPPISVWVDDIRERRT